MVGIGAITSRYSEKEPAPTSFLGSFPWLGGGAGKDPGNEVGARASGPDSRTGRNGALRWNGTLKYGDFHEKFNFLKEGGKGFLRDA